MIDMDGQMTKRGSSFGGCSTVATRRAVRSAVADPMVKAVMLRICSPGGTVYGTSDLAEDVAAAAKVKPVDAYVSDMACSAAYWVASQCRTIYSNTTGQTGSIGTMIVLQDDTGAQEQLGVKLTVVSTGEYKGLWASGEVTDKLISDEQRQVDELNASFLAAVTAGRGRRLPDLDAVADGRVYAAAQAKQLGLIDQIASFDAAMAALTAEIQIMTTDEFNAYAAANPAAIQPFVDRGHQAGHAAGRTAGLSRGRPYDKERFDRQAQNEDKLAELQQKRQQALDEAEAIMARQQADDKKRAVDQTLQEQLKQAGGPADRAALTADANAAKAAVDRAAAMAQQNAVYKELRDAQIQGLQAQAAAGDHSAAAELKRVQAAREYEAELAKIQMVQRTGTDAQKAEAAADIARLNAARTAATADQLRKAELEILQERAAAGDAQAQATAAGPRGGR